MSTTSVLVESCPLCGATHATSASERKRQLSLQLRSLENGSTQIKDLSPLCSQMCTQCQMMMIGITSEDDRLELRDRILKELEPISAEAQRANLPGEAGAREEAREKMLDKTLADSFPTSDPPSSIPDPEADDSLAA